MITGIDLILADHRGVEQLFSEYAKEHDAAIAAQIFAELTAHDEAETGALYPLMIAVLGAASVDEALLAHSHLKSLIDGTRALEGAPFDDAMKLVQATVEEHVADEEKNLLPKLAKAATDAQLTGLAARIEQVKQRAG